MVKRFICHNQVFCILFFFFYHVCFQANCSSSFSSSYPNTTHYLCPPKQSLALLQFKSTTPVGSEPYQSSGECSSRKTVSWTESSDCCSWEGVTCDEVTGNVIGLDLDCSYLEGNIEDKSTLFHLSHLKWLNLAYNNFNGSQISHQFGRLTELTQLNLSCSGFKGLVPSEISYLSKLTSLDLSNADFGDLSIDQQNFGLLAHNLTRLSVLKLCMTDMSSVNSFSLLNLSWSMTILDLGLTGIQAKFPKEIFHLPNLQELYLFYNGDLTGYLPKSNWSSHLRVLHLDSTSFKGEIPDSIGNLKFLEVLSIGLCNFTGSIPTSIGNLTRLSELDLESNYFVGELPSSISKLQKVTHINLSGNMLTGQLPEIFVNFSLSSSVSPQLPYHASELSHLTNLDLSENFLNGRIPSWLFTLPSLDYLDLSRNNLADPIDQFNLSNSLGEVYLQNNEIQGPVPSSIFELVNLTVLDISSNYLSGTVKFDTLSKLKNLEKLDLSNNNLLSFSSTSNMNFSLPNLTSLTFSFCNVSEFPMSLRTLEKLESLDLSNNRIHGWISKSELEGWNSLTDLDLSNNFLTYIEQHPWKNIKTLNLQNNMIRGSILVPPPTTGVLLMSNNQLTGQIPPSICNLSSLGYLGLSNNSLSGKIPSCLGNLSIGLVMLHLQKNNLQGSIPDTFDKRSSMLSLDLSDNRLEGPLPRSLINSRQLEVINLGNNKIVDRFPCWLGTLSELKVLVLKSNRFYGPICDPKIDSLPFCNLQILDLSHNEFTGFLPRRFFERLIAMVNVDKDDTGVQYMGRNYYKDSINLTMKGMEIRLERIITIFTSIDLSNNGFQREIPGVIGKFESLLVLNLSHNSLTGKIPRSLGNLTALESLDLSSNKLDGRIPDELISVTTLAALNLSYNRLSGLIPQGNQFNTFENGSFIGNKGLCGKPLSVMCGNDEIPAQLPPSSGSNEEDDTASGFDWKIVMMGYASGLVIRLSIGYTVFSTGKPQWFVKMVEGKRQIKKVRRSNQRRWI